MVRRGADLQLLGDALLDVFAHRLLCEIWAPWRIVVVGEGGAPSLPASPSAPPARLPHPPIRPSPPLRPPARPEMRATNLVAGALVGRVVGLLGPSLAISEESSDLLDGTRDGVLIILLLVAKTRQQVLA